MSSNQDLNKVERSKLLEVVRNAGLTVTEQTAYTKCTFECSPAKIYIANTKKVTRVDLSGYTLKRDGIVQISQEDAKSLKLGNVNAQLDFTQSEEVVLEALAKAAEALKEVQPIHVAKPVHKTPKVKTATAEVVEVTETTEVTPENDAKTHRRQAIKEAAERQAAAATV